MSLYLLLACVSASKAPDDVSSSDTSDSGEPTDSASDSSAGGDSTPPALDGPRRGGVSPTPWSPGDEIPGWADAACDAPLSQQTFTNRFPHVQLLVPSFTAAGQGPTGLEIRLRDCLSFDCTIADTEIDRTHPFVHATLSSAGAPEAPLGTGLWGPDEAAPRSVVGEGSVILGDWSNNGWQHQFEVETCIERLRPDEVRGYVAVWWVVEESGVRGTTVPWFYLAFPFTTRFPAHGGVDLRQPQDEALEPEGFTNAHIEYAVDYEAAWPWDDITDPWIRAQVEERYRPYNTP